MNRPYVVGSLLGQIGSVFQLGVFGISFPMRKAKLCSVELPMKENVSGYSRNPCSLNRERDAAFAAKLLTLPTGFFRQRNLRSGWRVRQYDLTTSLRQRRRRAISQ